MEGTPRWRTQRLQKEKPTSDLQLATCDHAQISDSLVRQWLDHYERRSDDGSQIPLQMAEFDERQTELDGLRARIKVCDG